MTLKDTIALGLTGSDITDRDTTGTDMTKTDMIYRGQYSEFSDKHVYNMVIYKVYQNLIRYDIKHDPDMISICYHQSLVCLYT